MNSQQKSVKDYTGDPVSMAESNYQSDLESFFRDKWGDTNLWSHDLSHHQRVWQYAKQLMAAEGPETDYLFAVKLIIGCYLHDTGMSVCTGEKHGVFSRQICEEFLLLKGMDPGQYKDLTGAVETHDDKHYSDKDEGNRLHLLLSVSDDLDAFGHTGILRYFEIYTRRGFTVPDLCSAVLKNAGLRYNNFIRKFGGLHDLVNNHSLRYRILKDFYIELSSETAPASDQ